MTTQEIKKRLEIGEDVEWEGGIFRKTNKVNSSHLFGIPVELVEGSNIYKKLAQASGKTETEIMRDMYEKKLIPKEENLRLRLSYYYFGNYEASKEDIEKQIEKNLLSKEIKYV